MFVPLFTAVGFVLAAADQGLVSPFSLSLLDLVELLAVQPALLGKQPPMPTARAGCGGGGWWGGEWCVVCACGSGKS